MRSTPKLLFVSLWKADDPNVESGYAYSMRQQLARRFDVVDLFPLGLPGESAWLALRAAYKIRGQYYHPMREPGVLKRLAAKIERALAGVEPDIVFAPSSIPMSFVATKTPWVFSTDQLFSDFVETYIPRPSRRFRRLGHAQETRALATAARAVYPSDWAARGAVGVYGADPRKVEVVPWGANVPHPIGDDEIAAAIEARPSDRCNLVFVGRDWRRKGGDVLVATVAALRRMGVAVHATIIGCRPAGLGLPDFTVHEFIDKRDPRQLAVFSDATKSAHFLFLPSRAEAYGQVFCEAAMFGVPSIGSTVGGIPTIIRDDETGYVRPPETSAEDFARLIRDTLAAPEKYRAMARAARADYLARLNWDRFGDRLGAIMDETIEADRRNSGSG